MKPSMSGVLVKICVERYSPVFAKRSLASLAFASFRAITSFPQIGGQCRRVHPGSDRSHRSDPVVVRSQISGIPTRSTGSEHADLTDERQCLQVGNTSFEVVEFGLDIFIISR